MRFLFRVLEPANLIRGVRGLRFQFGELLPRMVRIEHLLMHTSGWPATAYIEALLRHAHQIGGTELPIGKPADVIEFLRGADDWVECPPGERWFYFNEGYVALGEIITRLTGQPYEQYIRDHILQPL